MDASTLFLLRLWGPALLIVGLSILLNPDGYKKVLKEIANGFSALYYIAAVIPLTIGLAMVLVHNRWETLPEILVSTLGWGSLIKGTTRLLVPDASKKLLHSISGMNMMPWAIIIVAWGGAMSWMGFF